MKRLLTLKLSILLILLSSVAFGKNIDKKLVSYEKLRVSQNPAVEVKNLNLAFKKDLGDGWYGYLFKIELKFKGKDVKTNDIIYSNGKVVTSELKKPTGFDYKRMMHPILDKRYTDKKNLIAGNVDAKHQVVIFSDPLCPICVSVMPDLIEVVKAHPKELSLYYISMPLDRLHPTSRTLIKASKVAHNQGVKDVHLKVYGGHFDTYYNPYKEKDQQKALDTFNKILNTNITMKQINNTEIQKDLEYHIQLADDAMIAGTPTIFFDGEVDPMRNKYKKVIK